MENKTLEELYRNFKKTKPVQITVVSEDEEKIEMTLSDFQGFINKVYKAGRESDRRAFCEVCKTFINIHTGERSK